MLDLAHPDARRGNKRHQHIVVCGKPMALPPPPELSESKKVFFADLRLFYKSAFLRRAASTNGSAARPLPSQTPPLGKCLPPCQ